MHRIRSFFARLARDQRGLTTVEYAILLCVIISVSVGLWDTFGEQTRAALEKSTGLIIGVFAPGAG